MYIIIFICKEWNRLISTVPGSRSVLNKLLIKPIRPDLSKSYLNRIKNNINHTISRICANQKHFIQKTNTNRYKQAVTLTCLCSLVF